MIRMFIRHPVEDFDRWLKAYNDFAPTQKRLGVQDEGVFRNVDDDRDVTVFHDFSSLDEARTFADSDEVKSAMGDAGVAGPPDIWFAEQP